MPWTLQEQRSPDPIHTHTHRGIALFSWAKEACPEHSSPKCYSMGIRLAVGYRVGSLEPWPSLSPSAAMPTEGHHFGLASRNGAEVQAWRGLTSQWHP